MQLYQLNTAANNCDPSPAQANKAKKETQTSIFKQIIKIMIQQNAINKGLTLNTTTWVG